MSQLEPLLLPAELDRLYSRSISVEASVELARCTVADVLRGSDDRLLVLCGPCFVPDTAACLDYAQWLRQIAEEYKDTLVVLMLVHLGFVSDPYMDGSCAVNAGLLMARKLLLDINALGLPAAIYIRAPLDTIYVPYLSDLVSWGCMESCGLASGLPMPVGIYHGSVAATRHPQSYIGVLPTGMLAVVHTLGNEDSHVVLRDDGPLSEQSPCEPSVVFDCSNSKVLCAKVALRVNNGCQRIRGAIIESQARHPNGERSDCDAVKERLHQLAQSVKARRSTVS